MRGATRSTSSFGGLSDRAHVIANARRHVSRYALEADSLKCAPLCVDDCAVSHRVERTLTTQILRLLVNQERTEHCSTLHKFTLAGRQLGLAAEIADERTDQPPRLAIRRGPAVKLPVCCQPQRIAPARGPTVRGRTSLQFHAAICLP